ncbi:ester cyclase [Sandaracinobacteroides saxicola]|uniref:Nuclear transport factor 2 family protein n=1 Tax=Sandaracinobacteroides saxicola TaxID=2759707 RepID=A0A7G5IEU5_9SPHN|nr:nuclear transport factor 2 family protein [Sandaracinobacteroides saxicola]QMW21887.1 nuclear transport factor 2 family protein [Sandaracinobacteroides saxicola]
MNAIALPVRHATNKAMLASLLAELAQGDIPAALARHCHPDCIFDIFHPFNRIEGIHAAAERFWQPLRTAFPNAEQRLAFVIGGTYEGREQVSSWGHLMATFDAPWLGIPPTHGLIALRFGVNALVRDGRIAKAYVLLDIVDLMAQAGLYPFRRMPGSPAQWAFPPCDTGATALGADPEQGATTLAIVREMQMGLPKPAEFATLETSPSRHSHHWHPDMNWYGPAGIGSMRGQRGFRDFHGALFLQAFPDRSGRPRDPNGPEDGPGHYTQLGDGRYAVTGGWPSLVATHLGGEWLGLPPTGRRIEMRVADWYRLDADNRIIDNWVMMDIPHIVHQMGLDLFHDLGFITNPAQPRWPR